MAHRQLQAAEMATANSPIASRTRKRGVGNMGTSNNVNPQTTVAASAPSRAAKPKAAAPVAQVSIMATPEATAPTPGLVSNTAATPGTFRPTFGRRFAPRDETDTRSVRSLPSAAPDQSQIDEYDMNTPQYQGKSLHSVGCLLRCNHQTAKSRAIQSKILANQIINTSLSRYALCSS